MLDIDYHETFKLSPLVENLIFQKNHFSISKKNIIEISLGEYSVFYQGC